MRRVPAGTTADHACVPVNGYEQFFGFNEAPFSLAPDTRFRFESASHEAALTEITYALQRREPLVVVTGEIGTGKTLLCRTVLKRLERKTFLSIINDPLLERDDLLKQMLQDFGVISKDRTKVAPASRHDLIHALQEFLAALARLQAHAVLIIDEAQHVRPEVLEEIRLISNIQDEHGTMLQIILVGQTDLEALLSRPELRQLKQRISRHVRLESLSALEVGHYIDHRLTVARERHTGSNIPGASELERALAEWDGPKRSVTFAPEAIHAVSQLSRGIPRLVNLLCDRALEAAFAQRARIVDVLLIHSAGRALDVSGAPPPTALDRVDLPAEPVPIAFRETAPPRVARRTRRRSIVAALLALAAAAIWFGGRAINRPPNGEPASQAAPTPQQPGIRSPAAPAVAPAAPQIASAPPASRPAPDDSAVPPKTATIGGAATAPKPGGEDFEIIVASFRTAARATDVAADVAALGQPVRQRALGGWEQVLAGPFKTRAQADAARERLARAGYAGTQIVAAPR